MQACLKPALAAALRLTKQPRQPLPFPLQEEVILETGAVPNATAKVMTVHAIPSFASRDILEALVGEGLLEAPAA